MRKLIGIASAFALVLAMAVPAVAHPATPSQSLCVLPAAAANGIHNAAGKVKVDSVAAHVLFVKSPHFCD